MTDRTKLPVPSRVDQARQRPPDAELWRLRAIEAEAEVAELRQALEWYGDERNYQFSPVSLGEALTWRYAVISDRGSRARAALTRGEPDAD